MKLNWQAIDVIKAVQGQSQNQNWQATGVSIDSRTIQAGDIFIAITGDKMDGHDYVNAAFQNGAVTAITSKSQTTHHDTVIHVADTFTALTQIGIAGRARCQAKIIGVTGSVGKTSSKEMLATALGHGAYANQGGLNNHWGVPLSLARLPADAQYGVFEMGMNHAGEMEVLSKQVRPHLALITTIEAVHLEFFASTEAIADAKAEIFLGMNGDGIVILNHDNPHFARLKNAAQKHGIKNIFSFGRHADANARLISLHNNSAGMVIEAQIMGHTITYPLSVMGEHLAMNSLGVLLTSVLAGGDMKTCAENLAKHQQPSGRGIITKVKINQGEFTVMDESYNASPIAMRAAIKVLGSMPISRGARRIVALGDMKELGAGAEKMHTALLGDLMEAKINQVHCCGAMMESLYEALPMGMRGFYAQNSAELSATIAQTLQAGDVIMVKGSNSMNMKSVVLALHARDTENKKKPAIL